MKAIRSKLAYATIAFGFLTAAAGADLAVPGRHVLAGGPAIKAGWTPSGLIEVAGYYFSPNTKVQIYEYADGSSTPGALHYVSTGASGAFDTSFAQGVCASKADELQMYDPIYGWSNPVTLPSAC